VADLLTTMSSVVGGDGPQWMPDGARIVFPANLGFGTFWTVNPDSGGLARLTGDLSAQSPRLSPDGRTIAYISDKGGNPEVWVWSVPDARDVQLTKLGARVNALSWSPDGRSLAFAALRLGSYDIWTVAVADGAIRRITHGDEHELVPEWTPDGRSLVYLRADDRWVDHDVMVVLSAGVMPVVASDQFSTTGRSGCKFGPALVCPTAHACSFARPVAAGSTTGRSCWSWRTKGMAPEPADQTDARWSPDGNSVAFVSNRNGTLDLRVVAARGGEARVVVPVATGVIGNPAWSPDGRRIAYTLATPTRVADLYVVDLAGKSPKQLTFSQLPAMEGVLVTPQKVSYRSDEYTISGYLLRPPNARPGQRFPGILYIHGGPTGQFSDSYNQQAQFLAGMGYVVLMPNIRGSSGYGFAFEKANDPCWTICDLRDVEAGAAYLKSMPDVDGTRLGITGISYGGIMSMAAVARAPDLFQAAIPQSGYADWVSFHEYNAELGHAKLLAHEWGPSTARPYIAATRSSRRTGQGRSS
jgi:dipeptidyl aminopeptidase/acylaminoacyl peptidase